MKKIAMSIFALATLAACSNVNMPTSKSNIIKQEFEKVFNQNELVGREFIVESEHYKNKKITIAFDKERVYGFSGVNRYFATYKIVNNKLVFGNFGMTRMAGKKEDQLAELAFITALKDNKEIKLEEPYLYLYSNEDFNFKFRDKNYVEEVVPVKK